MKKTDLVKKVKDFANEYVFVNHLEPGAPATFAKGWAKRNFSAFCSVYKHLDVTNGLTNQQIYETVKNIFHDTITTDKYTAVEIAQWGGLYSMFIKNCFN